jgi:hypothetical protein
VDQGIMIIIQVYVDDIIFESDDDRLSQNFSKDMHNEFEIFLLGELNFFLGLQISQLDEGIFISQTKYIKEMLKKIKMEDCKSVSTPMVTGCKLRKYDKSKEVDQRLYKSIIGSLLYVTTSRPDAMQEFGQVSIFQVAPKETHVLEVKRTFIYSKGVIDFGLWYPKGNDMTIVTYADANWARSIDDIRSTSGEDLYSSERMVPWLSKNNSSVSLCTTEA